MLSRSRSGACAQKSMIRSRRRSFIPSAAWAMYLISRSLDASVVVDRHARLGLFADIAADLLLCRQLLVCELAGAVIAHGQRGGTHQSAAPTQPGGGGRLVA